MVPIVLATACWLAADFCLRQLAGVNGQCHGEMLLLEDETAVLGFVRHGSALQPRRGFKSMINFKLSQADDCRRTYWVASGKREHCCLVYSAMLD